MEFTERLAYLESVRDWQQVREELEKQIGSTKSNEQKAQLHLKLGRLLDERFLLGVKALKHFQDAYKLNPQLVESLEEARRIYWDLGKLNMVQKLLDLELKANPQGAIASAKLLELADVLCDLDQYDAATPTYAKSLGASGGSNSNASASLEDQQVEASGWDERVGSIVKEAGTASGDAKARLFLRAARILRRFQGADATEGFLRQAYREAPTNAEAAALFEALLADQKRLEEIENTQKEILGAVSDEDARAVLALAFGRRWAMRHQNADIAARFLEEALTRDPGNEAAFHKLAEIHGSKDRWGDVLKLADRCIDQAKSDASALTFLLAEAGTIAWKQVADLMKARGYFQRLKSVSPEHHQLKSFEKQIGEELEAIPVGAGGAAPAAAKPAPKAEPKPEPKPEPEPAPKAEAKPEPKPEPTPEPTPAPPPAAKAETPAPAPVAAAAPVAEGEGHAPDEGKVAELKAQLAKFEAAKRWGEVAKTLLSLVAVLADDFDRVEAALRAADIYANQLRNQVEAIKAFELVRTIEPNNPVAVEFLVKAYEQRREFEKLLALRRQEADELPPGPARAAKFAELARLATEKVKKPEVCIAYWKEVVDNDPGNLEGITQLGGFYERAKDFESLTGVLEKEVELTGDRAKKVATLKKLGTIYGDRLNNDEGAVEAWRRLLELDPNDKQAQEALKKKYLALQRWDDLEQFYAESGKWDEFIRVLEQQEAKETENAAKAGLLFKIAQLWNDRKQKTDRAAKAYERILELDASNLRAAEALVPIYQQVGNAPALARAYEVKLEHADDPIAKLELYRDVAGLYEGKVADPNKAFDRFRAAFEIAPEDDLGSEDLERVAKGTGRWDEVVSTYDKTIKDLNDPETATRLRLRLGRVYIEEQGKVDQAVAQFRAVYEENPENADALGALERLYKQTKRYEDLLAIYAKKRELATDAEERKGILYSIARLYVEELNDAKKAVATYKEVLEEAPEDATALSALDTLYRGLEDWQAYVDVLRKRLELPNDDATTVDLKFRLGQTLEKHLGDSAGALDNYREILGLDPTHDGARLALEKMLEADATDLETKTEVAGILEGIYEAREDWERLIGVLEILAKAETDTGRKVELLRKSARTAMGMLGDASRAFDAQARALAVDPTHAEARAELVELANANGAWDKLVDVLAKTAEGIEDPPLKREYWFRIASLQEQKLNKVEAAAKSYEAILELDPADADALAALEQLYLRTERWNDLIKVVQKRIDLADDAGAREALYGRMASIYEERLGKPEDAIASWREVLSIDPTSTRALAALEGLYSRQERWTDLADNLEAQLRLAETDDAQIQLMLRLAQLRETRMNELDQAIEIYRQVLEREPQSADALAALERLGKEPKHEQAIAEILEPLYKSFGDWQKLIGVYEVFVRRSEEPERRVELLHQIGQLYEDQGNQSSAAFDSLARALAEDPSSEQTMAGLQRLAEATGRWQDLGRVLDERAAAATEDPALASTLQTAAARVHEEALQDVDGAVARYRRVLELDPVNLPAAESLERLFQLAERWPDLSAILQRKAEILENTDDKKQALFSAASIEEDVLQRVDPAIAVYQKILELDPEEERALEALMKHFLELQRWNDLLDVYQRKVDLVGDPDDKKRVLYQMGAVWERELKDVNKAIETYQRVLELDPADLTALGRLDVLYQASSNWTELLGILQRESELSNDPGETISFQYRIAELYESHLEDVPRAIDLYRDVLNAEPSHAPTLRRLEALKDSSTEAIGAASVLEPIYEGAGDWARLVSVLEVQVKHAEDELSKVELLHRIARLFDEQLNDPNKSFDVYARALAFNNADENTLISLEALADRTNRWPEVARLYDAELDKLAENPPQLVYLGLRLAQLFEVQLNDVDSAVARYRRVLDVENDNQQAIKSLDRLFTQTERWNDLAQVLAREAEVGQTPDEILEFKYRLGEVYERHLGDLDQAIAAYKEVLAVEPEHTKAMARLESIFATGKMQLEIGEILEPLYRQFDQYDKLVNIYEAQLGTLKDPAERLSMYYRLAELHEEKLADGNKALEAHTRALKEQPTDERAHEEAERIAGTIGEYDSLANAYADILGATQDAATVRLVGGKLAKTFEEQLGDQQKAEETYRYVLGVDATDVNTLENLDRIYVQWGSHEQLADILQKRTKATEDEITLVELFARLGQVYEESLVRVDDAIAAYKRIFDSLDKQHEGAIAALARLYEQKEAWTDLLTVYERELENAVGDVAEAEIQAKIAHLAADRLNDIPRAIELWKRVLDLRGEDPEALGALANLYEKQQMWPELGDVLERLSDASSEDSERAAHLARRARIFTEKLQRDDLALDEWQRVLDINYEHVAALRAIADIRRRQGDHAELVMALQNIVERTARLLDEDELKDIYRELGKTYGTILEQPIDAADAWRKLLEVDPSDFEAMNQLEEIYRKDEQWTDVIGVKMQRAAALPDPEEKVRELFEVTDLWYGQASNPDGATEANTKILEIDPANERAFVTLEQLHGDGNRAAELAELYVHRLEQVEEGKGRQELYRKIAKVLDEKLEDSSQAFEVLVNAFSEDFDEDATVKDLERLTQSTQRWGDLVQTANAWLKEPGIQSDTPKKISLMLRLAKWYGEDIGKPEWAMPYFQQVQKLDPHNVRVIRQVASLYKKAGNYDQYGSTLTNALEISTSEKDRKEISVELGELLERQKKDVDQAVVYYKRALDVDPTFQPAIDALENIYNQRGQTRDVVDMLERKVQSRADATELNPTRVKLAGLYVNQLNDLERAGQLYRDALEGDPSNLQAMRGLKVVYQQTMDWQRLHALLEQELEAVQTERERVAVLRELAAVLEDHFIKPELAAQRLEQALEIDPNDDEAYRAVERNYAKLRRFQDLVAAYDRHIAAATDDTVRVEIYGAMGKVYADELDDVERAVDAYRNITDIDSNNVAALEALSRLYEKQGETQLALDAMQRVADLTFDTAQKVEMLYRIGKAHDEKLGDRVTAQERFRAALDFDPAHLQSLAALRQIALDTADWYEAAQLLDQEQNNTVAPRQKAKLLVELGKLREEMLSEHEAAIQAFEMAIQADPENEDAAQPLGEEYVNNGRFEEAEPLLELLTRKATKRDKQEQHKLYAMFGKALAAQGKNDRALKAYQQSFQADPTDMEVVRGLAEVCFNLEDWPAALSNYQKVLTSLDDSDQELRTEVYFRLGSIKRKQGQARQAITNYEKALEIDPAHRPTLEALVGVYSDNKDWKQVVEYKRQILDNVMDGEERYAILNEIGDVWANNDKNLPKAIDALEEALELKPENHVLLHKLLQHYQGAEQWTKMIETIERIASLETSADRKSKYFYTMAQLYRDKENDQDKAVEYFNLALDNDPQFLKAFEAINKILTIQKDWKNMERAFRKMLHRIAGKGNSDLEFNLWHNLGLIYRDRLKQPEAGIEAFRMSSRLKPEDMQERQILAELYEMGGQIDNAVHELQDVLVRDPMRVDPYQALYKLYMKAGLFDRAWCIAAALHFLKKADGEQTAFFEERKPKGMLGFRARLDNEQWVLNIFHPEQDKILGKLFEMITPAARTAKLLQLRAARQIPDVPKKFLQDPATTTVTFAKAFFGGVQILGLQPPVLYVRNDVPGALTAAPMDPPSSVAGATVLSGFTPQELMFLIGKHLTYYRGEHYIKTLFPSLTELKTLLLTAVKIAMPEFPLPDDMQKGVMTTAQELVKYMQPVQADGLRLVVKRFVEEGAKADIKRWMQTSDVTAIRAGFVLCGDLEMAAKLIRAEQVVAGDLSPSEKLKELIQYAVSEQYFNVRTHLGIAIT